MIIKAMDSSDFDKVREIHNKHYEYEFPLGSMFDNALALFTVTDNNGKIITAGGIRTILEGVLVTDKDCSVRERRQALYYILQACMFASGKLGYDQIHAFIQDDSWIKHLERVGFYPTKGKSVVLCL